MGIWLEVKHVIMSSAAPIVQLKLQTSSIQKVPAIVLGNTKGENRRRCSSVAQSLAFLPIHGADYEQWANAF